MNKKIIKAVVGGLLAALIIISMMWAIMKPTDTSEENREVIIERVKQGVKLVVCCNDISQVNGTKRGALLHSGTAFVINHDGYMVTNAHVASRPINPDGTGGVRPLKPNEKLYIIYLKGNSIVVQNVHVIHLEPSKDLALLKVDNPDDSLKPLPLGRKPADSQEVIALGYPGIYDNKGKLNEIWWDKVIWKHIKNSSNFLTDKITIPSVTQEMKDLMKVVTVTGNATTVRNAENLMTGMGIDASLQRITHTATLYGGMSGGPLVNRKGEVVGVDYGGKNNDNALNVSISVTELKDLLEKLEGPGFYLTGDPDSVMRTLRSYINKAKPYEIAMAILGLVLCVGAVFTLGLLVLRRKPARQRPHVVPVPSPVSAPAPGPNMDDGVTRPLNAAESRDEDAKTMVFNGDGGKLVLTGTDPNGRALRFEVSEEQLKNKRSILMGSQRATCGVCLPYRYVSRQQARLIYKLDAGGDGCLYIKDENATNTTKVNGKPINTEYPLYDGDAITMGPITLTLGIE